jgi:serine/threonine-protein kinase PpkA
MDKAQIEPLPHIRGYEITRRLGRGGMADVYLAVQVSLSRPVAIKVLAAERNLGEETVTRFEQEARTIARLDHPNVVSIYDVGRTEDGKLYYVMPYLPNGDLSTRDLREHEIEIIAIVRSLVRALGYAHKHGIVHRDVKPENVLFDKLDRPLLADFGIALASSDFARVTREGSTIGSSGYMSPEQARGLPIDGRADLYSLGVVTYELVSGDLPYHGPDTLSVALAHVEQPIPRLLPRRRRWQPFIDKAMAKSPEERFQNAEQMEGALDAIAEQLGDKPDAAYSTVLLPTLADAPARRRAVSGLALTIGLALGGAALVAFGLMRLHEAPKAAGTAGPIAAAEVAATPAVPEEPPRSGDAKPVEPASAADSTPPAIPAATGSQTNAAAQSGVQTETTPAEPAKPELPRASQKPKTIALATRRRISDLAAGAVLRDPDGPALAFVPANDAGRPFALERREVTRAEYAAFAAATHRAASKCREPHSPLSLLRKLTWHDPGFSQNDTHPVVCVSWADANAYAQWLGMRLHATYRLPSHAEWVRADRPVADKGDACALGNLADTARRGETACSDGFANTAPVGRFKANALGIHDLIGNVSEWTIDCKGGKRDDKCDEHMFSGSSWRDDRGTDPDTQDDAGSDVGYTTIGFRVLRELDDDNIPAGGK